MSININKKYILFAILILICLFAVFKIFVSPLSLKDKNIEVEVKHEFNPESNIKYVVFGDKKDVLIDKKIRNILLV